MAGNQQGTHTPLSAEAAASLLDRLGSDDAFRAQFQSDPARALGAIGHGGDLARTAVAGASCMNVQALAPKEEIRAARDQLMSYLTSQGTHTVVHCFESGAVSTSLASPPATEL